jgi:hypothetical protein
MPPDSLPAPSSAHAASASPAAFQLEEFRQLRTTIRDRSTARVVVSFITFVSWGGLALVVRHSSESLLDGLVPLVVLAAGFELALALHVGVERIGRYLAVFYEAAPGLPKWETAIAAFGRRTVRARTPPPALMANEFIFIVFIVAAGINLALVLAVTFDRAVLAQDVALAVLHATFVARVFQAVRQAGRQREADEAAFRAIAQDLGA